MGHFSQESPLEWRLKRLLMFLWIGRHNDDQGQTVFIAGNLVWSPDILNTGFCFILPKSCARNFNKRHRVCLETPKTFRTSTSDTRGWRKRWLYLKSKPSVWTEWIRWVPKVHRWPRSNCQPRRGEGEGVADGGGNDIRQCLRGVAFSFFFPTRFTHIHSFIHPPVATLLPTHPLNTSPRTHAHTHSSLAPTHSLIHWLTHSTAMPIFIHPFIIHSFIEFFSNSVSHFCILDWLLRNRSAVQAAMQNAQLKIDTATHLIKDSQGRYDSSIKTLKESNDELGKVLAEIAKFDMQKINFEKIRETLIKGIKALAQLREQWGKLVLFFQTISNLIRCSLDTSLKEFIETTKAGQYVSAKPWENGLLSLEPCRFDIGPYWYCSRGGPSCFTASIHFRRVQQISL